MNFWLGIDERHPSSIQLSSSECGNIVLQSTRCFIFDQFVNQEGQSGSVHPDKASQLLEFG